jgi:hypothetical protein
MIRKSATRQLSPEFELLLCCGRYRPEPDQQAKLEQLLAGDLDWRRVLVEAEYHGLLPLLHAHLGRRELVPADVRESLLASARQTLVRNMELTAELRRLTGLFQSLGWRFLWFKGPLAAEMCGDQPGLRSYSDLDLLIDLATFPECLDVLRHEGYFPQFSLADHWLERQFREYTELTFFHASRPRMIDVHWQLTPECYSFALAARKVWPRVRHVELEGTPIPTLSVEETFLYYCLHAAKHNWSQLKWLVDVAELLRAHPDTDWLGVWNRDIADHNRLLFAVGLKLAGDLLEGPLPEPLRASLPEGGQFRHVYDAACRHVVQGPPASGTVRQWPWRAPYYQSMTRASDRRQRLYDVLIRPTPLEWQLCPLASPWSALHFAMRPARLIVRSVQRRLGAWRRG